MAIVRAELPPPTVRALALQAELLDAGPQAVELGLLDELCTPELLLERALQVAGGLAELPRGAYTRVKDQLRGATVAELEAVVADDPMRGDWLGEESAAASRAILDRG
jgi:hypothetical protein